jgi:nitrogen-specific signal transduction histidine kinase/ActR/RegA family two-component response regulator
MLHGPVVLRWHLIPEKDEHGKVRSLVSIAQDITATRQLETERLKASKLESLGVLAGGIAHDFNNVLTSIMGNLSLAITSENAGRDVKSLLAKAEQSCNRASELTSRLLVFARGGAPSRKPVDLEGTVRAAVAQALDDSRVEAAFNFPAELRRVYADPQQLSRAIFNLADNACLAMDGSGRLEVMARDIELETGNPLGLNAGHYVVVSLRDFGVGIGADLKAKIFDPYFTTRPDSSGLGLTTAYFIAGRHGGTIEVESTPGKGATFNLFLQASSHPVTTEPVSRVEQARLEGPPRVLLMDDEPSLLDVSGRVIELLGFRVGKAADGEQALALYREAAEAGDPYHVVILDITVPSGMGGVETLKWLKQIDPNVRAIVSSGYSNDPVMSDYRAYGFSGVLPKPYRVNELQDMLSGILAR